MIATLTLRTEKGEETISGRILVDDRSTLILAIEDAIERYRRFERERQKQIYNRKPVKVRV